MNDPYLNIGTACQRLYDEYLKYGKLVVACDYDDTIYDFHKKGHTYTAVIDLLLECQKLGFYICIFTGSPLDKYPEIMEYTKNLGLNIATINKNPFPMPFGNDGKMYYNILLDDRAGLTESYYILSYTVREANKK